MHADRHDRKTSSRTVARRAFLQTTAALAGAALVRGAPAVLEPGSPNETLDVAVIGTGGRGGANLGGVRKENIVALCDVREQNMARAARAHPRARKFTDFRKLFDEVGSFDAAVVSTCEHTHAYATLPALQLRKHVYCEKPLTYNVAEARIIREAAVKAGVATQMGTQIHAGENYRRVVELIRAGAIGPVSETHVWVSRAWGWHASVEDAKRARDIVTVLDRPAETHPVPQGLHWDLWLGPAPKRPFNRVYVPGPRWYRWWDFGNGTMSDLGSHWIDLPFWALDLDHPRTIEASGPPVHPEIAPASMEVRYTYGARGDRPPLELTWYQGTHKPAMWKDGKIPRWGNGVLFVGKRGMLLADYGKHVLLPEKDFADYERPAPSIPRSIGHHAEWVHACKTGAPTTCNFEYAGWLTEANHLGNVAFRVGKKLEWDAEAMNVSNAPEAERYLRREPREGWKLA